MSLRGCGSYHFIWTIKDGEVRKVSNMDALGTPRPKFRNLDEILQHTDVERTSLPFAKRETIERNDYIVEENESDSSFEENSLEELTLSQIKKRFKRKKRKASESVILTTKAGSVASDLDEPLCKFRVKYSKSSWSKKVSANETSSTSEPSEELATVNFKLQNPEVEYSDSKHDSKIGESESSTNDGENCETSSTSEPSEDLATVDFKLQNPEVLEYFESNHYSKRGDPESSTNGGEKCELNLASFDSLDDIKLTEMENEEIISNVNQLPSLLIASKDTVYLQQPPEQFSYTSDVHDSNPALDDEHNEDTVSMEPESPISEETTDLTSMNIDADSDSLVPNDITIHQELLSTVPTNADTEVKTDNDDQTGALKIRQPERHPLTRKFISPNSREKLCQAMASVEPLDDIDHYKCKEKLYFGEQAENTFSLTKPDVEDNKLNDTKLIQNKGVISSKHVFKRLKNHKKESPTQKGGLDGPRLCRSLPRISTGCTSIEGCSESAIAFSQRQMHDFESLASRLMSELNSMKVIVEEKMLYEAYRSPSLKNEADEVKSAIKGATKTEETARRWLSMMARDCNRFCKIMKLNEDQSTSASGDPPAMGNTNQNKPVEREKKKISFADEVGGTLCDIKVYQIEPESPLP